MEGSCPPLPRAGSWKGNGSPGGGQYLQSPVQANMPNNLSITHVAHSTPFAPYLVENLGDRRCDG